MWIFLINFLHGQFWRVPNILINDTHTPKRLGQTKKTSKERKHLSPTL